MLETWNKIVSQYDGLKGIDYEEQLKLSVAIDEKVKTFLDELERETRETKRVVLGEVCVSEYFYCALNRATPPSAVAYTLISKGLYDTGVCETPDAFLDEVRYLVDGLSDVEVPGGPDRHRSSVLGNPLIDPKILEDEFDLSEGRDNDIVFAVLNNPVAPERLLRSLFEGQFGPNENYEGYEVLSNLIQHPGTPRDILEAIVSGDYEWVIDEESQQELVSDAQEKLGS